MQALDVHSLAWHISKPWVIASGALMPVTNSST